MSPNRGIAATSSKISNAGQTIIPAAGPLLQELQKSDLVRQISLGKVMHGAKVPKMRIYRHNDLCLTLSVLGNGAGQKFFLYGPDLDALQTKVAELGESFPN